MLEGFATLSAERYEKDRMSRHRAVDPERLLHDAKWAIERDLGPRDLVPMLDKLVAHSARGSAACHAPKHLARVVRLRP
jgi:hypothetical protein